MELPHADHKNRVLPDSCKPSCNPWSCHSRTFISFLRSSCLLTPEWHWHALPLSSWPWVFNFFLKYRKKKVWTPNRNLDYYLVTRTSIYVWNLSVYWKKSLSTILSLRGWSSDSFSNLSSVTYFSNTSSCFQFALHHFNILQHCHLIKIWQQLQMFATWSKCPKNSWESMWWIIWRLKVSQISQPKDWNLLALILKVCSSSDLLQDIYDTWVLFLNFWYK